MSWIGIDLGGTKAYGVVLGDTHGDEPDVKAEAKRKTPTSGGPPAVVDTLVALVEDLGGLHGVKGVGVGAPGVVDSATGVVSRAPNLPGWDESVPLGDELGDRLGVQVVVDNDVNVGTLAEVRVGAAIGAADVLGVFVGTGVGGGIVLDGHVRRGPSGVAGEIGHTIVQPDGAECGCGGRGHLEAYAGRSGIERRARERAAAGEKTKLLDFGKSKRMTSSVVAKALEDGDEVAVQLLDDAVDALGVALASAVTLVDLELIVLGGGLADRLGAEFVGRVEQAVRTRLFVHGSVLRVVRAALGDRGGAVGAALLAAG